MSAVLEKRAAYIEVEDYLTLEASSRFKHEYLNGVIYSWQGDETRGKAGGSAAHADIIRNVGFALHTRLKGSACQVKLTEMRLRVRAVDAFFYPDVLVHCGRIEDPSATLELTSARLVVEVLSPTTQLFDRGQKLAAYRQLAGLRTVMLLASGHEQAWAMQRDSDDGEWGPMAEWPRGSTLAIPSLGLELPWGEIYDGVGLS